MPSVQLSKNFLKLLPIFLLFLALNTCSSDFWENLTSLYVEEYTLDNGLKVYFSKNGSDGVVKTQIIVRAGSKDDPPGATGLAHYLEHLLFKGTSKIGTVDFASEKKYLDKIDSLFEKRYQSRNEAERNQLYRQIDELSNRASEFVVAGEFDKLLLSIGVYDINAFTTNDSTFYVATVPKNQIKNWLLLEKERFSDMVVRGFHTELETVFEEKNESLYNIQSVIYQSILKTSFQSHPYGSNTTIGTISDLKNPSIYKVKEFYKKYYVPENMAIAVSGDFSKSATLEKIKDTFGTLPPQNKDWKKDREAELKPKKENKKSWNNFRKGSFTEYFAEVPQEKVVFTLVFPNSSPKELALVKTISNILSDGNSGILDSSLYYSQIAESVLTYVDSKKDFSLLVCEINLSKNASIRDAKQKFIQALEEIKNGNIYRETLDSIKLNLAIKHENSKFSNEYRLEEIRNAFAFGMDWNVYESYLQEINLLTIPDLQTHMAQFSNEMISTIHVKPGNSFFERIQKPGITPLKFSKQLGSEFYKNFSKKPEFELEIEENGIDQKVEKLTSENGIEVYYQNYNETKYFELSFLFKKGLFTDKNLENSIEYFNLLGTELYNSFAIQKKFYSYGVTPSITTANGDVLFSLTGYSENFEYALSLFEHSIFNRVSNRDVWNVIFENVKFRKKYSLEESIYDFDSLMNLAIYQNGGPNLFFKSIPEMEKSRASDVSDALKNLFKYKCKILYYGPLSKRKLIKNHLQTYLEKPGLLDIEKEKKFQYLDLNYNTSFVIDKKIPQTEIYFFAKFPKEFQPPLGAFAIYKAYTQSMASPFFQELRESRALGYSPFQSILPPVSQNESYIFLGSVKCQSDKMKETIETSLSIFKNASFENIPFVDLKNGVISQLTRNSTTNGNMIGDFLSQEVLNLTGDVNFKTIQELEKMEEKDFLNFKKDIAKNPFYSIIILGDKTNINTAFLQSIGKVKIVSPNDIIKY